MHANALMKVIMYKRTQEDVPFSYLCRVTMLGFTSDNFSWTSYLKMTKAQAAPKHLFKNYENVSLVVLNLICTSAGLSTTSISGHKVACQLGGLVGRIIQQ